MIEIPKRIRNLTPYVAGKTIAEVKRRYNVDTISKLASNENRLGCSPNVHQSVVKALEEIQDYPDPLAYELRLELAKRNGVNESEIIVAAGSESILSILCRSLLSKSNNIVTADATFVGIYVQGGVMGAEIKKVPVTSGYEFDTEAMLEAVDHNTKMIYIANPNNPSGTYIGKDEYASFIDRVPDHVLVVADEAYFEYARHVENYPHALNYRRENVIVTRTFSKGYGLAGFRIGYAIAHNDLISQLLKCKLTFEPTTLAQAAALAAVRDDEFLEKSVSLVAKEREKLRLFFDDNGVEYVPSISNSVMMVCNSEKKAGQITQAMLEKGVILRQLNAFGLPHCVRITIGTEQEMNHFKKSFVAIRNS
ncbi:histidinol-phosphate transaminase [Rhodohalobacter sp. 8-1]|uniref:histidinol-phosphate transaminase n=1 Tax=Rhodohalobacter sp. 8-1 TaxID=3131972 RepID=UPI0030EF7B72